MPQGRAARQPLIVVLWANALALALFAVALLARQGEQRHGSDALPGLLPSAHAQAIAGGGGLYLMPAQLASNIWGVYVMDVDRRSLMAYQFDPSGKRLNFLAAREITHDRMLGNYNTYPDPLEIKTVAEKERQNDRLPAADD